MQSGLPRDRYKAPSGVGKLPPPVPPEDRPPPRPSRLARWALELRGLGGALLLMLTLFGGFVIVRQKRVQLSLDRALGSIRALPPQQPARQRERESGMLPWRGSRGR